MSEQDRTPRRRIWGAPVFWSTHKTVAATAAAAATLLAAKVIARRRREADEARLGSRPVNFPEEDQ